MFGKILILISFFFFGFCSLSQQAEEMYKRGLEAYNRKEFSLADSLISLAISYDQKNNVQDYLKYYNRGVIRKDMDSINFAISDFTSSLKLYPNFYEALENRAICYFLYAKSDLALKDMNEALKIRPADVGGTVVKCLINFELEKYEEIILDCSKALVKKKDPRIYAYRALAHCKTDKIDKAKKDLEMGNYYFLDGASRLTEAEIYYHFCIGKNVCDLEKEITELNELDWHYIIKDDVFIEKVKSCLSE